MVSGSVRDLYAFFSSFHGEHILFCHKKKVWCFHAVFVSIWIDEWYMDWYIRSSGQRQLGEPATQRSSLWERGSRWTSLTDWFNSLLNACSVVVTAQARRAAATKKGKAYSPPWRLLLSGQPVPGPLIWRRMRLTEIFNRLFIKSSLWGASFIPEHPETQGRTPSSPVHWLAASPWLPLVNCGSGKSWVRVARWSFQPLYSMCLSHLPFLSRHFKRTIILICFAQRMSILLLTLKGPRALGVSCGCQVRL